MVINNISPAFDMDNLPTEILFNIVGDSYYVHQLFQVTMKKYYRYAKYKKEFFDEYFEQQVFIEKNTVVYKIRGIIGNRTSSLPSVCNDYSIEWYRNGKLHRDNDKPAVEYSNGSKHWYKNGLRHRDNGKPAIERSDGSKIWYKNDQLHRDDDKPVVEYSDGIKCWYKNGQLHYVQ